MVCDEHDYAFLRELVLRESANRIDPARNELFDVRLTSVTQMAGASSLKHLVEILRRRRSANLHRAVAEAMTVNETSFFRDVKPFEVLASEILPQLIARRRTTRRLRLWSAASSTGQEAYSSAMLLADRFPELDSWEIEVIGTDISRSVIDYARAGRYCRSEIQRGLPARLLLKYMRQQGEYWIMEESVRARCSFQCANLCGALPLMPQFDIVLLRNVLLYLSLSDREQVFRTIRRLMPQDGYLLLGNSEQAEEATTLFRAEFSSCSGTYFYRPV